MDKDLLTRRRLLAAAGAAAAGALAGPRAVDLLGGGGGGPLPALPELPVRRDGHRVRARLEARPRAAGRLGYAGRDPGPLLRLREGDDVRLAFRNALREPTNLHLHGVPIAPAQDAPFRRLLPGEGATYDWRQPEGSAGVAWYHPHLHGSVGAQLAAGLAGPVLVEGPADREPELRGADDRLLVLREGDGGPTLVNGARTPVLRARRSLLRLRLLNATAGRFVRVALAGTDEPLHLIATDGGLLDRPHAHAEIVLAPGERAEVLVALSRATALRELPYARAGGRPDGEARDLVRLEPPDRSTPTRLPGALRPPIARLSPRDATCRRRVVFAVDDYGRFTINARTFDRRRVDGRVRPGDLELWEIVNTDTADHPFHLHTFPVQVLERDGRPEELTAWRDVVTVRGGRRVLLAIQFAGHTGTTVFHCHVGEHEYGGMMGVVTVGDPPAAARASAAATAAPSAALAPRVCDLTAT